MFQGNLKELLARDRHEFIQDLSCVINEVKAQGFEDFEDPDVIFRVKGANLQVFHSRTLIQWSYDIAKGMQYLANNHILHGDLAARNILITGNIFWVQ